MKKTPLKKIGKIGRANIGANRRLRALFRDKGIYGCELNLKDCLGDFTSAFAHRHKRIWYKGDVEKLSDWKQVVIACAECHLLIDNDKDLTEKLFLKLRGTE